jgi:hypothetical protein
LPAKVSARFFRRLLAGRGFDVESPSVEQQQLDRMPEVTEARSGRLESCSW